MKLNPEGEVQIGVILKWIEIGANRATLRKSLENLYRCGMIAQLDIEIERGKKMIEDAKQNRKKS